MTRARILIVEDEKITAEDLQEILTDLGYIVCAVVSSGTEAIQQAELTVPDLVLMDIRLKGEMDGTAAARILREQFDIPVVYLTAHADADTLARAKVAEPLGYIVKPFQEVDLKASIEMALHKQALDGQRRDRERHLYRTLSAIEEGVITIDREAKVVYMNEFAEKWTGWTLGEAGGKELDEIFRLHRESRLPATQVVYRALREGVLTELGETLVSRYGVQSAVQGSGAPIRDHFGVPSGAIILFARASDQPATDHTTSESEIVAESAAMRQLVQFTRRVAKSGVSAVLITGESGTGKEILARHLHLHSSRHTRPFFALNCASIPETLLESELFGYEKGAFTDARHQKQGILELTEGGSLFLDEVAEMPLALQAKMLRVVEQQAFRRLGGIQDIRVDVRLLTATHQDLAAAIEQGRFRLDLYYRLNVIQISIPPLRDRREDILPLARRFISTYNQRFNRNIHGLSPEAADILLARDWPGNVRELRNVIERAMVLEDSQWIQATSVIVPSVSSRNIAASGTVSQTDHTSLEDARRSMVLQALKSCDWNQTRAARLLSVSRDKLRYAMKKYNLKSPRASLDGSG